MLTARGSRVALGVAMGAMVLAYLVSLVTWPRGGEWGYWVMVALTCGAAAVVAAQLWVTRLPRHSEAAIAARAYLIGMVVAFVLMLGYRLVSQDRDPGPAGAMFVVGCLVGAYLEWRWRSRSCGSRDRGAPQ